MRLKTFSAPSMSEAMLMVKEHFGGDAIIVSSQKGENGLGVRITAAVDHVEEDHAFDEEMGFDDFPDPIDAIGDALAHHGAPASVTDKILNLAGDLSLDDSHLSLAGALDQAFDFAPLPDMKGGGTIMLVGLPGAGKTVTTAKLATQAVLGRGSVNVITTDTIRAGGFKQLEAFTKILEIDLMSAANPSELKDAMIAGIPEAGTIIDCAGGNPFDKNDLKRQRDLIQAVEAEVILLLADGTDPLEAADIAEIYSDLGAGGLITTRIDVARRHGALLSAASAGELVIRGGGMGPSVTDGLKPLNPVALARLLLPDTEDAASESGAAASRGSYV
jgi:flagellar biosynthesis protein FlhF